MSHQRHSRRSFLRGEAAATELSDLATRPAVADSGGQTVATAAATNCWAKGRESLLVSVRRRAMACEWEVQLAAARNDNSMERVFGSLDLVEALEAQMTVYRTDSEVQRINRHAAEGPVLVEPRLFALFQLAQELYRDTAGALDITSGPLSETWGFSRRRGRVPLAEEIAAALAHVGMADVVLDAELGTIAFRRPGITVNFNSIGKGYALDRMSELLDEDQVDHYLLHGGKSSVLARGDQPGREPDSGWTIGLRHPLRPAERLGEFCLRNRSLSTSGSGTQFFRRRGRRYGHILDPRTGQPVEGIYSATVIAPTAAAADALSTAFYVMGPEKVAAYCRQHPEVSAVLITPAEREGAVRIDSFGLDDVQWRQLLDE